MKTKTDSWKLDADSLLKELDLTKEEKRIARTKASDLVEAIANSHPSVERQEAEAPGQLMSAGAPLYIPGVKLHLNVGKAAKLALVGSVAILVKAMALGHAGLVELSEPMTAGVLTAFINQFSVLTDAQRKILDSICALKSRSKLPGYAPTSAAIAQELKLKPAAIDKELKPLVGKVVSFDRPSKTWKILF